jgi:hypothetical protein
MTKSRKVLEGPASSSASSEAQLTMGQRCLRAIFLLSKLSAGIDRCLIWLSYAVAHSWSTLTVMRGILVTLSSNRIR